MANSLSVASASYFDGAELERDAKYSWMFPEYYKYLCSADDAKRTHTQ